MIIRCTQKLAKKLSEVSAAPLAETSPLGSWTANLYTIDRRRCVLFCHDETRYVLFVAGLRKEQFEELGLLHRQLFLSLLAKQGVAETQLKKVAFALGPVRFDRATDRSVLGSMNVVLFYLELHLERLADSRDEDTMKAVLTVNERPATVRGKVIWPDKAMMERIALL
jgi:hypothetical protein